MAEPTTTKPKTSKSTTKSKSGGRNAGALGLILAGLLLIAGGVDNVAVTVPHVQLIAPGALAVQVVFVLVGLAVLLRGLDGLWGTALRSAGGQLVVRWRRWRAAWPPIHVAGIRPPFEPALAIDETNLGPEHPDPATSLNNQAGLLQAQGELAAARPLFERALGIRERVLGPDHPDSLSTRRHLRQNLS